MRRASTALFRALAATCILGSCDESTGPDTSRLVARVVITPDADTTNALGDTVTFAVEVADANGFAIPSPVVTWRATVPAVVAISDGRVVSLTTGTVGVIA